MKYPHVLFFRYARYSDVDIQLDAAKLDCTVTIVDTKEQLIQLFDPSHQILVTYGPDETEYVDECNAVIAPRMRNRWVHYKTLPTLPEFSRAVNYCFVHNCTLLREMIRPVFSVFSSAYNSFDKIRRAYDSLKAQTLRDWEWIVLDDSPDDKHFEFLRTLLGKDPRVRLYRRSENSGNIGNVKNEAVSLCRGKYVVELDHDDELTETVLQDAAAYFDKHKDVGFIYMDFINVFEKTGENFSYGDFFGKGYSSYYCQKIKGKWRMVYITANINNVTLSHLVCMPNHPRIWRKDELMRAGNYCELLPINDDQEILMRTAITTKIAKLHKVGYVQYMNENNNNFSLIRNAEINRIGPFFLQPIFYDILKIGEAMKEKDAFEDEVYIHRHSKIWKRPAPYEHRFCNDVVNVDFDKQYCILGLDTLIRHLDKITELAKANPRFDFLLLDNKAALPYLWTKLDDFGLSRFKCYSLLDDTREEMLHYFTMLYKSCDLYEVIEEPEFLERPIFNTPLAERHSIINRFTQPESKYLEIGVEYGETFQRVHFLNKIGVDPDPKYNDASIQRMTSDDYFRFGVSHDIMFDVVFIDGMHHAENLIDDFNNTLQHLSDGGIVFLDDVMPHSHDEQLKVPRRHYYENGILKYREPWTGDVWKVLYYMLLENLVPDHTQLFFHPHYRGVAMLPQPTKRIPPEAKEIVNQYDYWRDFPRYLKLLSQKTNIEELPRVQQIASLD